MLQLTSAFSALGDPVRLAITERLLQHGPLSAGHLQDVAEVSPPAISRHLKVLRKAGVIMQTVDKQRRIYSINPQAVESIGTWALSHREFWAASLDRLADAIEREE